jgi:hypothetical protein
MVTPMPICLAYLRGKGRRHRIIALDGAFRGERGFAVHQQCFQDAASTRARRNCVFVLTEDRSGRDFANWNARE